LLREALLFYDESSDEINFDDNNLDAVPESQQIVMKEATESLAEDFKKVAIIESIYI
jgi:hypothetical protein